MLVFPSGSDKCDACDTSASMSTTRQMVFAHAKMAAKMGVAGGWLVFPMGFLQCFE